MTEWVWIDIDIALTIHQRSLLFHGGADGIRDQSLLESALARPQQLLGYSQNMDAVTLAAAYTHAILRNHPFIDGNKRTAFVVGVLFLELNGGIFTATEADATRAVLDLAAGLSKEADYIQFMRTNSRLE